MFCDYLFLLFTITMIMIQSHTSSDPAAFLAQGHYGCRLVALPGVTDTFLEITVYLDSLSLFDVKVHAILAELWRCPFHGRQAPFFGNG